MKIKGILLAVAAFVLMTGTSNAQCKNLIKKGLPALAPYTHNGQMNSAAIPEGGVVDYKVSCYKGLTYRLNVLADEVLGKVTFKVLDEDNEEVYNSADAKNNVWDFAVSSSQDLTVEVSAPLSDKKGKGCVALLVGFKAPKKSNGLR